MAYYVTIIDGKRYGRLAGPYPTHQQVLDQVDPAKDMAYRLNSREAGSDGIHDQAADIPHVTEARYQVGSQREPDTEGRQREDQCRGSSLPDPLPVSAPWVQK